MKRSLSRFPRLVARWLRALVVVPIRVYQRLISPALPRRCKYYPTCSEYAVEAIRELGVARGLILAAWRLLRWESGGRRCWAAAHAERRSPRR